MDQNDDKRQMNFTFNFNGSVGQNIAHVENMTVHFDKDMNMQVAMVENATTAAGEERKEPASATGLTAELLRPYITAGFLQEDLQPAVGMSNGEKAVLAHDIATRFNLTNYYPFFERLWNVNHLHSYYSGYLNTQKSVAFINRLNKLKFSYMEGIG